MPVQHEVRHGECCSSIAADYGFAWDAVWNHADNAALRSTRADPNILLPGDILTIPDKQLAMQTRATGARHLFHVKCVPLFFCMKLRRPDGTLRGGQPYALFIAGAQTAQGVIGDDGAVRLAIPQSALEGELRVGSGDEEAVFQLQFGSLAPIDSPRGLKARLNNLGFDCGDVDDEFDPPTRTALRLFQTTVGLRPTGYPDDETMAELQALHDSFDEAAAE